MDAVTELTLTGDTHRSFTPSTSALGTLFMHITDLAICTPDLAISIAVRRAAERVGWTAPVSVELPSEVAEM
eukprot:1177963-Prymnesium_polylepis.1